MNGYTFILSPGRETVSYRSHSTDSWLVQQFFVLMHNTKYHDTEAKPNSLMRNSNFLVFVLDYHTSQGVAIKCDYVST